MPLAGRFCVGRAWSRLMRRISILLDAYSWPLAVLAVSVSFVSDAGAGLGLALLVALWLWP